MLLPPRVAYDRVAGSYREWHWYRFWRTNEAPIVGAWLRSLPRGCGLDAGSGTGPYVPAVVELGHRCVAVDTSPEMLKRSDGAVALGPGGARPWRVQADITALPFVRDGFAWILCTRTLSHVADLESATRELARVLAPGGECLITDVHPDHVYEHVRIPHEGTYVRIETYKHPIEHVRAVLARSDLRVTSLTAYGLDDLIEPPPRAEFAKLYAQPARPIFYVCRLIKVPRSAAPSPRMGATSTARKG